jgi:hypothetical protein
MTRAAANKASTALNRSKIALTLHQQVLLDIRFLDHLAYQLRSYNLPDKYDTRYVVPAVVSKLNKTKVDLTINLLGTRGKPLVIDVKRAQSPDTLLCNSRPLHTQTSSSS